MPTHPVHVALFLHLAGFLGGLALYGMLLGLALRAGHLPRRAAAAANAGLAAWPLRIDSANGLHVFAGLAGVVWNAGAMVVYGAADVSETWRPIGPAVAAYSALGFLPAAAAHSALRSVPGGVAWGRVLIGVAYTLSACAATLNGYGGATGAALPSVLAMRMLTVGFAVLALAILVAARRQGIWRQALLLLALSVFAVTAVHLADHQDSRPLWLQLMGRHAALPLAVAILVQDYPLAFSDLLLERILSVAGLVGLGLLGVLAIISSPLSGVMRSDPDRPLVTGTLLLLVVTVALAYQVIRRWASAFVDRVVLRRGDADSVLARIGLLASQSEEEGALVSQSGPVLSGALTAVDFRWHDPRDGSEPAVVQAIANWEASSRLQSVMLDPTSRSAVVVVPTADLPWHVAFVGHLPGSRPFLSADVSLLRDAALVLAHRIDAIRMGHERFEQALRRQEVARLAVDAELRALRAQINPHFLFNALTTIGYLVPTAPDRAVRTLLRLTDLLRRVLRSEDAVVTVASELQLVEAYLDIERARFEERLRVSIDVPDEVKRVSIPSFVLQPLVENAVKHGVAPSRTGGTVSITARIEPGLGPGTGIDHLVLVVADSGSAARPAPDTDGEGIGLANVRRRLELAYGPEATVTLEPAPGGGTRSVVDVPVRHARGRFEAPPGTTAGPEEPL